MMLRGKNAVLTGCLRGIGRSTLEEFARHGANIWACAQHHDPEFEASCKLLANRYDVWVQPVYFDLLDEAAIKSGVKEIFASKKRIDALVNIAGFTRDSLFHMTSFEQMRQVFEVNFFSQMVITQLITRAMIRQRTGSVVNVSSISALDGIAGQISYSASKAAIVGATKTLSRELAPSGIRVNAVAPGVIDTQMNASVPSAILEARIKALALPRLGRPHEVASAILFLASDYSAYMTGQVIRVDGGV